MILVIPKYICNDISFLSWLLPKIRIELLKQIKLKKLKNIELKLINENILSDKQINTQKVLISLTKYLTVKDIKDNFVIYFKCNKKYPGTNISYIDICKTINYGNLNIQGYPIITQVFNDVKLHLSELYYIYVQQIYHL